MTVLAGADGCKAGWVAVIECDGVPAAPQVFSRFDDLLEALGPDFILGVDMPIGLPERAGHGGRGPELAARIHLGKRQSSVFSIPSRQAIYAESPDGLSWDEALAAHQRASAVARATSDPPRGVSIQAFFLFPKIREIDAVMQVRPDLHDRIIECHPELAFWRLNGERAMDLPKKIKGRVNPAGMAERRDLLVRSGVPDTLFQAPVPRGSGEDDYLDAMACLMMARRHALGLAVPFPDPPLRDGCGIPMAIRA